VGGKTGNDKCGVLPCAATLGVGMTAKTDNGKSEMRGSFTAFRMTTWRGRTVAAMVTAAGWSLHSHPS
jgi:hypothetical protein